ncbi:hypothetical protein [uncultured Reyranella sp.]|jgi:hypothetical protein|nr:hypothetical protein [uncultured Reyranella sp.]
MSADGESEYDRLMRADRKAEGRLIWSELVSLVFVAGLVAAYMLFFPA